MRDASRWESEGVCVSRASFASPVPPMEVCGGAEPLEGAPKFQIRNPNRVRGLVPAGVWGVPQSPSLPPRMGDWGLKARMETVLKGSERMVAGGHGPPYGYCWIPAPRLHEDKLRGNDTEKVSPQGEFETRPYTSPQSACRGAVRLRRMPRVWS